VLLWERSEGEHVRPSVGQHGGSAGNFSLSFSTTRACWAQTCSTPGWAKMVRTRVATRAWANFGTPVSRLRMSSASLPRGPEGRLHGVPETFANSLVVVWAYTPGLPVGRLSGPLSGSNPYTTRWDVNGRSELGNARRRFGLTKALGIAPYRQGISILQIRDSRSGWLPAWLPEGRFEELARVTTKPVSPGQIRWAVHGGPYSVGIQDIGDRQPS
jgi:hypothetical protein